MMEDSDRDTSGVKKKPSMVDQLRGDGGQTDSKKKDIGDIKIPVINSINDYFGQKPGVDAA